MEKLPILKIYTHAHFLIVSISIMGPPPLGGGRPVGGGSGRAPLASEVGQCSRNKILVQRKPLFIVQNIVYPVLFKDWVEDHRRKLLRPIQNFTEATG